MAGQLVCFSPALSVTLVQVRSRKSVLTRIGVLLEEFQRISKEIESYGGVQLLVMIRARLQPLGCRAEVGQRTGPSEERRSRNSETRC